MAGSLDFYVPFQQYRKQVVYYRTISSAIYFRVLGQVTALAIHGVNIYVMLTSMGDQEVMRDKEIREMTEMQSRYLTVWNIFFQLLYFSIALICDTARLTKRDRLLPKSFRIFRLTIFAALVVPTTVLVVELFWPIFIFDRSLVYPAFIDQIFSFKSHLVLHLIVLPLALWELVFLPKTVPRSHTGYLVTMLLMDLGYNVFVSVTYMQWGRFPYLIVQMLYGTIYLALFVLAAHVLQIFNYFVQWHITAMIWGDDMPAKKKKKL